MLVSLARTRFDRQEILLLGEAAELVYNAARTII